ncbi:DUF6345 domain-containing protein [Chitinivorax sp. B]|uniref:DUF6345 domain-containing protein n=1 Tax=Chitinivorax sp. B TaxID=2502235 RepID=UPI0010F8BEF1|nr:DUF6345 domain-containing protein [Chitinivorax sp. B]
MAEQLPVFKLAEPEINYSQANAVLTGLHGGRLPFSAEIQDKQHSVVQRVANKEVEFQKASGGIFARDTTQLWNPNLRPQLPDQANTKSIADQFINRLNLLPTNQPNVRVSFAGFSETGMATEGANSTLSTKTILDRQANYQVDMVISTPHGQARTLPVVGGGGKYKVAVGDQGAVIGYHGVWRPITGVVSREEILSRAEAEAQFRKSAGKLRLLRTESFLAYYSAPAFEKQEYLAPVWVVKAEANIAGNRVPLRNAIIAATRYGPRINIPQLATVEQRQALSFPEIGAVNLGETIGGFQLNPTAIYTLSADDAINEGGTSWIGASQGLPGSQANAQGFVNRLSSAGWTIRFNWGEGNAWESDWNANDDVYVDAVDFAFYTGHANSDGWVFNAPNDTFLHYTEVGAIAGSPNDRYGEQDLEWMVIAACGPHQSNHFTTGIGSAFDRWRGIFDGLHVFLGYGAVTYDNTTEGSRVTELALAGWTIIDAWFRAAWEIQPSTNGFSAPNGPTIYVTAMYAHMGDNATRNDRIWGAGATVADPVGPIQQRVLLWSGT